MSHALPNALPASWRWVAGLLTLVALIAVVATSSAAPGSVAAAVPGATPAPALTQLAAEHPARVVDVIVQRTAGADAAALSGRIEGLGGTVGRELPLIDGFVARMRADAAVLLAGAEGVRAVSPDARIEETGLVDPGSLATAYNQSIRADRAWERGYTGKGVGVAVIDTGIRGDLADFRVSQSDGTSRVVANAVVNPEATDGGDTFGHGTHVAGLIAGNGANRDAGDPLYGRYAGVAPDANLIAIKADDGHGGATVVDVIDALQFAVEKKSELNIRVVNLSLRSTSAESYKTDPLDAAAEATWNAGIVVVAAAGNMGGASDAVQYAPANDPYVITVGAVDDMGTKDIEDDKLASWSSRGTTQDGIAKPDVLAPGARLVSTIPAGSDYTQLCPQCVTDGQYFRVGGTSMAAAVVSGAVATVLEAYPAWTPDQVKANLVKRTRAVVETTESSGMLVDASGEPEPAGTTVQSTIVGGEIAIDKVIANPLTSVANEGLTPNQWLDPATGGIDYSRTSWSRTSWSEALDYLRTSWSRTSWSRTSWSRTSWSATPDNCADLERTSWSRTSWSAEDSETARSECDALLASIDPTRTSWSRTSWSRTSWSRTSWSSSFDK